LEIPQVDFLHRTVRDFLGADDIKKWLVAHCGKDFHADILLCRLYLSNLKAVPVRIENLAGLKTITIRFSRHAKQVETRCIEDQPEGLEDVAHPIDEFERALSSYNAAEAP
jgi:hypothetical protein